MNVCPPIVADPLRAGPAFAATLNRTVPLPTPEAPEMIVSQDSLLVAVHVQVAAADTETLNPLDPPAPTDWLAGLMDDTEHGPAVPAA